MIDLVEGSDEFNSIKDEWMEKVSKVTMETLPDLLKDITENYNHDYGTICHAVAVSAIAAAKAVDRSPAGGITGFQAGCIMWQFVREWNHSSNKTGLSLVDYDNFLYPQYEEDFDKTLNKDVWDNIQKEAQINIDKADKDREKYLVDSDQFNSDIAEFVKDYPDYYDRKEYYDPIGMGTYAQHQAEKEKRESGFNFAPQPPYCMVDSDSPVYVHWKSITAGLIPFGYRLKP